MLEQYEKAHKKLPRKLYIQVDGGPENANKYVLSMIELLISKRVCKEIFLTRLPTGHTHEDIGKRFCIEHIYNRSYNSLCLPCSCLKH